MLTIRVELNSAITGKTTELARMHIFNDGTSGDSSKGHYGVRVMRKGTTDVIQRTAEVRNHARLSQPVWNLVRKALEAAGF
jgi:hypothetical protein